MDVIWFVLTALLSGGIGLAGGYRWARRQPVVEPPPRTLVARLPAQVYCHVRIIGPLEFHSHCTGKPRFDRFTVANPGHVMKDTGHWVRAA